MTNTQLKRDLGLPQLVLYGAGTILGAGIYVLVGEVVGRGNYLSSLSFLLAGIIVAFSAYSFAKLAQRFPLSEGGVAYVQAAFSTNWLSVLVGYSIIFMGITSSATIARGLHGYLSLFIHWPHWGVSIFFVAILTAIAIRGIRFAVGIAIIATLLEVAGLLIVIYSAKDNLGIVLDNPSAYFLPQSLSDLGGITLGAYLAFYACIGFEDMVNLAEEVKKPERNMPLGIAIVLVATTLLYILVTLAAVTSAPLEALSDSSSPLALVVEHNAPSFVGLVGAISAIAVTNGALIQIIMCSRVLYGMSSRHLAPKFLGQLHATRQVPQRATLLTGALVLFFTLLLPLTTLAEITSTIVLCVFTLVNLALLTINLREQNWGFLALGMPFSGAILSVLFMAIQLIVR